MTFLCLSLFPSFRPESLPSVVLIIHLCATPLQDLIDEVTQDNPSMPEFVERLQQQGPEGSARSGKDQDDQTKFKEK